MHNFQIDNLLYELSMIVDGVLAGRKYAELI